MQSVYLIYCVLLLFSLVHGDAYFDAQAQGLAEQGDELGDDRLVHQDMVEQETIYDGVFVDIPNDETATPVAPSHRMQSQSTMHRESRFDDHVLVKLSGLSPSDLAALETQSGYDVWSAHGDSAVLCLPRNDYLAMRQDLHTRSQDEHLVVLNDQLQSLIDDEAERLGARRPLSAQSEPLDWFADFHTYEETLAWYTQLQAKYPQCMKLMPDIGKTAEGRVLFAVKIGPYHHRHRANVTGTAGKPKKAIFLHALQHAREWISGSTINYIAYHLLLLYAKMGREKERASFPLTKTDGQDHRHDPLHDDPSFGFDVAFLEDVEFIIVPIMNPDGYVYTWTTNRLWRKNRNKWSSDPLGRFAVGVDLNRNWEDHWGVVGSSMNPFSDIYMGPSPASELEVQAMQNIFLNHTHIVAAVDFHAYSQLLLWPYGYTTELYQYHEEHRHIAKRMTKRIDAIHGRSFMAERICDLYMASGNALDFWSGKRVFEAFGGRSPYAFAFELRPTMDDSRGFILPPNEIIPAGQEVFSSVLEMVRQVIQNPLA